MQLSDFERLSDADKLKLIIELKEEFQKAKSEFEKLKELQSIFRVWVRLRQKLFPFNCSGEEIKGIDLNLLDSDVAGCVSIFLTRGRLEQRQIEALYYCDDCLDFVTLEMRQGYEGWYFRQLKTLTSAIIEYRRKWK